jgi:hypothetical protein
MKKRLNTESISNELKGASLFFRRPQIPSTEVPTTPLPPVQPVEAHSQRVPAPQAERTLRPPRSPRTPQRRFMVRHAFEVYQDQVEELRQLALEDRMSGGVGSMSQMVREAVDKLLRDRSRSREEK